jgi:hypothetical protein
VRDVTVREDGVVVNLTDGRTVSAPLAWYSRTLDGTPKERDNWRLIGSGEGVHWPDLDEDLSIDSLISGRPSGGSQASLKRWLEGRKVRAGRASGDKAVRKAAHPQRAASRHH